MKTSKVKIFVFALIVITIVAALLHLNTREAVAEGTLLISAGGDTITVDLSKLEFEPVIGTRVNGKGEEHTVDAPGISLKNVLAREKITDYTKVTVMSDDSYSAEVSAEEIADGSKAFLIVEEEKELRLVVFGDTNSKRSVSNVVQIVVE